MKNNVWRDRILDFLLVVLALGFFMLYMLTDTTVLDRLF